MRLSLSFPHLPLNSPHELGNELLLVVQSSLHREKSYCPIKLYVYIQALLKILKKKRPQVAVRHFTCLHGLSYFASGLKSAVSGWGIDGVGRSWSCLSGARRGLQTRKKIKLGAKGSSKGRDDCIFVASIHFRI